MGSSPGTLLSRLAEASDGLVYSSESDRPFRVFNLPAERMAGTGAGWPVDGRTFAALVGAEPDEPVEERSLDDFFFPHIECVEPVDRQAWERLPRYDALKALLIRELEAVRVIRIGRVQVRCYLVGRDADGGISGLETVAIET
jgi:hypothetical protein